ncbi:5'-nucleotidase [Actinophytocola sp. KF-1]
MGTFHYGVLPGQSVGGRTRVRAYQEQHVDEPLPKGTAFTFIKRLLSLNDIAEPHDPLIEVIVLSKNDPDTGLRVMRSIQHHRLPITRAIFTQGQSPYSYIPALNMSLFLSANGADVRDAVERGFPGGQVLHWSATEDPAADDDERDLRIAFDFDGVLAGDEAEQVMQQRGLEDFHQHESMNANTPHAPGPLQPFLAGINKIQKREEERRQQDPSYRIRVRVSVVTARNAPSHERAVASLKAWGVTVNDAFFLGGLDKGPILGVLRPHIFFDDQERHVRLTSKATPSVHVPFGVINHQKRSGTGSVVLGGDHVRSP